MTLGGLIKSNAFPDAYSCCCQFLSRIRPVIENSIENIQKLSPNLIEYQYHAALIDIHSQIKEGSSDVNIFPFIHACNQEFQITTDFIKLITKILNHYEYDINHECSNAEFIFYSSILSKTLPKFQESSIFSFGLSNKTLQECIQNEYNIISTKSKILLFQPTNNCQFHLQFYLNLKRFKNPIIFSLFAFVITKRNDPNHYILYILQNSDHESDWISISNEKISFISSNSLKKLSRSDENNFILFAFTDDIKNNVEFLSPTLKKIPILDLDLINENDASNSHSHSHHSQNQLKPVSPEVSQNSKYLDSNTIEKITKSYSPENDLSFQLCEVTLNLFSIQKMQFDCLFNRKIFFDEISTLVLDYSKKHKISEVFYTLNSENFKKYHRHLRFDSIINIYMQKRNEPQILLLYLTNYKVTIKFVCKDIKIFNTTTAFHPNQTVEDLYDFCFILLNKVLGIQIEKIKLYKNERKLRDRSLKVSDLFCTDNEERVIMFSYKEKC